MPALLHCGTSPSTIHYDISESERERSEGQPCDFSKLEAQPSKFLTNLILPTFYLGKMWAQHTPNHKHPISSIADRSIHHPPSINASLIIFLFHSPTIDPWLTQRTEFAAP
jgi:hypothetical protein